MIQFSFEQASCKKRSRKIALTQIKPPIIIGSIALPLSIFFLLVGFLAEKEMLINGFSALAIVVLMLSYIITFYLRVKKQIDSDYQNYSANGILEYSIEKKEDLYTIKCVQSQKIVEFKKKEIKKIYLFKDLIVIKFISKTLLDIPKKEEIMELFN